MIIGVQGVKTTMMTYDITFNISLYILNNAIQLSIPELHTMENFYLELNLSFNEWVNLTPWFRYSYHYFPGVDVGPGVVVGPGDVGLLQDSMLGDLGPLIASQSISLVSYRSHSWISLSKRKYSAL